MFRGYRAIEELMPHIRTLIGDLKISSPSVKVIRLEKRDLELIVRWPLAADAHGIRVSKDKRFILYEGYEILGRVGESRYGKPKDSGQMVIE